MQIAENELIWCKSSKNIDTVVFELLCLSNVVLYLLKLLCCLFQVVIQIRKLVNIFFHVIFMVLLCNNAYYFLKYAQGFIASFLDFFIQLSPSRNGLDRCCFFKWMMVVHEYLYLLNTISPKPSISYLYLRVNWVRSLCKLNKAFFTVSACEWN